MAQLADLCWKGSQAVVRHVETEEGGLAQLGGQRRQTVVRQVEDREERKLCPQSREGSSVDCRKDGGFG